MNRACTLLGAAIVLWGTAACHAGDGVIGLILARQQTTTSQPEPAILPLPKPLPAEPRPATLPAPRRMVSAPPAPIVDAPCKGVCASWCDTCSAQCQRLVEWATYRPLTRCGPCGCLPCITPCCTPPLYTFFLTDCVDGGSCGCTAAAHTMPAMPCKTCANKPQLTAECKTSTNQHQPASECKTSTNQHQITGLLPMMKSCIQCGFSANPAMPADQH